MTDPIVQVNHEHSLTEKRNIAWHFVASTRRLRTRSGNTDRDVRLFISKKP